MSLATNLQRAASSLIDTFGNSGSLYSFSGATTSTNDEKEVSITDWKTATSIKLVNGENSKEILDSLPQGTESIGNDEIIIKGTVTIGIKDRITMDSVDYKVIEIRPQRAQDLTIINIVLLTRVEDTAVWD